jgi:hypothetical protein
MPLIIRRNIWRKRWTLPNAAAIHPATNSVGSPAPAPE